MTPLKVALVQTPLQWEDIDANLLMFEEKLARIDPDTDLVILPEMFTTGFSMNTELAEEPRGKTYSWIKKMTALYKFAITGSFIAGEGSLYFNRILFSLPGGNVLEYNKKHLFRMADEEKHFTSGSSRTIVEYKGWKILPLICYDLRFPAWSRNHYHPSTEELDYDLLLYVANWPAPRANAWDTLLMARAIENHCYCAGVNRLGKDGTGKQYKGHSAVYGPKGEKHAFSEKEEVIYAELSLESLKEYREKFPAWLDG